jgi:dolichol kinase
LYFAASIAALMLASNGNTALFAVPILILTFADAFAAIVGKAYPCMRLGGAACGKTASGSIAFFLTALAVTLPALVVGTDFALLPAFAVALIVATATCVTEALSSKGFDNLAVPTVAMFILKLFSIGA